MLVCILTSAERMADESVTKCIICPGFFKTVEHLQSRRHMLKAVEYDYMITPQISAIKSELRAELDKEKRDAQEKAEQEQEAYRDQIVRETNMLYMERQEQLTGTSTLKYCSCCDKQMKRKNWAAHEKSQGHIRMSMAKAVEEKEAQDKAEQELAALSSPAQKNIYRDCQYCGQILKTNWSRHVKSAKHIRYEQEHANEVGEFLKEEQAEILRMDELANKICPVCNVPFDSWAQHKQYEAHKLNWAEAELAKLST